MGSRDPSLQPGVEWVRRKAGKMTLPLLHGIQGGSADLWVALSGDGEPGGWGRGHPLSCWGGTTPIIT